MKMSRVLQNSRIQNSKLARPHSPLVAKNELNEGDNAIQLPDKGLERQKNK